MIVSINDIYWLFNRCYKTEPQTFYLALEVLNSESYYVYPF
jgi:hypothetical protein